MKEMTKWNICAIWGFNFTFSFNLVKFLESLDPYFFGLPLWVAAKALIDRRMAEIEAQVRRGEPAEGMYLTYLLSSDKLSRAEVYITVTELLLGGVDTVRKGKRIVG